MAFSTTGYAGFINSMLEKRNQDIRAQIAAQEATAQDFAGIGSGLEGLAKGIGSGIKSGKQDSIYNSVGADKFGEKWGGGGQTEFDARMQIEKLNAIGKSSDADWKNTSRAMQIANYQGTSPGDIEARSRWNKEQADKATTTSRQATSDFTKQEDEILKSLNDTKNPPTPDESASLYQQLYTLRSRAGENQTNVPETVIQPNVSRTDQMLFDKLNKARLATLAPGTTPGTLAGGPAQQKQYEDLALKYKDPVTGRIGVPASGPPGAYGVPTYAPPPAVVLPAQLYAPPPTPVTTTAPSTSGQPKSSGSAPEGTVLYDKGKPVKIKRGGEWVDI